MDQPTSAEDVKGYSIKDMTSEPFNRTLVEFGYRKEALLEVLNVIQQKYGYLPEDQLRNVSDQLQLPLSHIYGVATFFSMFTLEPVGKKHLLICTDPSCSIAGAEAVAEACQRHAALSRNGQVTVETVTCLGLCDQAPAALLNQKAYVGLQADEVEALFAGNARRPRLQVVGGPRVMTRRIGRVSPTDLAAQQALGAFSGLEKALSQMSPEDVIEEMKASGLAGRGGAGFPTGLKWQFTRETTASPKYVVCNFDESEPGTFKDRVLVEGDPYRVIEGAIIAGYAVGAEQGIVFVRGEYLEATQVLQEAIDQLYTAELLGKGILNTAFNFDLTIRRSAGAYICGEETALFEAIEGNRGFPRSKPPFPTTHGLFGKPTVINNVESLALVPDIIMNGGKWLQQWGTEKSTGVKLFCLSGDVNIKGVVEAPFGITVRQLIEQYGGGFQGEPQAILIGGASGGLLHPDHLDTPLTNEDLGRLHASIGSGAVMVFNQEVNLLEVLKKVAAFFVHETCGQCVPCRVGTRQAYKLLDKISSGNGSQNDIDRLEHLCLSMRNIGMCGLGQTAPNPILSSLEHFRSSYEARVN